MKLGTFKKALFASAAVAAVSMAAPMDARADAYAAAGFRVFDFAVNVGSGFTSTTFRVFGNTATRGAGGVFIPGASTTGTTLNIAPACIDGSGGTVCDDVADNAFTTAIGNVPANGSFGRADIGYLNTTINSTIAAAGADGEWGAVAEARSQFPTGATGATVSGNFLKWTFSVPSSASRSMTFTYSADVMFELARATVGDSVSGSIGFSITIDGDVDGDGVAGTNEFVQNDAQINLNEVLDDAADALTVSGSATGIGFSVPLNIAACTVGTGVCASANRTFTMNFLIDASATADALQVPEPATLGLLGLGLAASGLAFRRRRKA